MTVDRCQHGFSLIEVILAVGIFAVAMVGIGTLLTGSLREVKRLTQLDALSAMAPTLERSICNMSQTSLKAVPAGTNAAGRPEWYAYIEQQNHPGETCTVHISSSKPSSFTAQDGHLYRARLYRAYGATGQEVDFSVTREAYPLRVTVEQFPYNADLSKAKSLATWTFHTVCIPTQ